MQTENLTDTPVRVVRLADYRPPSYRVTDTELTFEFADGSTRVTSRLQVERAPTAPPDAPLVLDGVDLELVSVTIDGMPIGANQYRVDAESLTIHSVPARAAVGIVTRIFPERNTALEGLYKSGGMYCTQCEAEGFRRITYYPDRPDVLARFRTTIVADAVRYPVALSNGNLIADQVLPDGRRAVTWEDPFPKPSYLFALVAGDLAVLQDVFVTASGRPVTLRIYSEPHNIGQCGYAMGALQRAMRWDEQEYGREYDLDIFMIVAVDDFNMGAMENKGLNLFNTSAVLASPDTATDAGYLQIEGIVAHEYFHNWSGNRVTCRDWFQLSLKEGFTVFRDEQFSADMNSRTVRRIEAVDLLRSVQFAEDASPLAHPVRPDSYQEISNFYTPTVYEKGSEVVRMLHTLLGAERFRAGSDLYFTRFDGMAVTTDDFLAAMAEAGGIDLDQFRLWYQQAGTPALHVATTWEAGRFTVRFEQRCPPTPGQPDKEPMHIPVLLGLIGPDGQELMPAPGMLRCTDPVSARTDGNSSGLLVEVRARVCELVVDGLASRPALSLLRGFSAPVRLHFERSADELAFLAEHDSDGFARWDALQSLVVATLAGRMAGRPADGVLVDLFGRLLDAALCADDAPETLGQLAAMLRLPDETYLYEQFTTVDVDGIDRVLNELTDAIARAHAPAWAALHRHYRTVGAYVPDARGIARRALGNLALAYRVRLLDGGDAATLIESQYRGADNLTDRHAALAEATRHAGLAAAVRERLLEDFLARWRDEALVVNRWFALQAASPLYPAAAVAKLARHPAFDARNPNKLRSVYGVFAERNHRCFHAADGSGYRLLADAVGSIDLTNPQVAARLAKPLTRWPRHAPLRQRLMRAALESLATGPQRSRDLQEVVTKGLAAD